MNRQTWHNPMQNELIIERTRRVRGQRSKNYIARGFRLMVKKVEDNKSTVTLWLAIASMVVTIGMNFVPWAYKAIGESAVQAERFEQGKRTSEAQTKQIETLTNTITNLADKVNALSVQQQAMETKINSRVRTKGKVSAPQQVVKNKSQLNGAMNKTYADSYATLDAPRMDRQ